MHFDEFEVFGHDDVEVDGGVFVLGVVEVEDGGALVDAGADGRDEFTEGEVGEAAGAEEAVEGDSHGDTAAGDGGGAGTSVGLEDVTIDPDGTLADFFEVDDSAESPADEALDLGGSAVEFSAVHIAGFAVVGGVGEHGILRGEPATFDFLLFHPAGDVVIDGGCADDAGIAEGDEDRAVGMGGDIGLE